MADVVFILGAGASKRGGAPLMADFLDAARALLVSESSRQHTHASNGPAFNVAAFNKVFEAIGKLQAIHSKAQLDIFNIESVFATLEMAKLLHKMPGYDTDHIDGLIDALKIVIASTLELTLKLSLSESGNIPTAPQPYPQFVKLLQDIRTASPPYNPVIITFNYDLALDYALHQVALPAKYCLDSTDPSSGVPVLKLHGSLNWVAQGSNVVPWRIGDILNQNPTNIFVYRGTEGPYFQITPHLINCRNEGQSPAGSQPVIVPPTWNKYEYQSQITAVWARAARELSDAKHIFVIGYS